MFIYFLQYWFSSCGFMLSWKIFIFFLILKDMYVWCIDIVISVAIPSRLSVLQAVYLALNTIIILVDVPI